MTINRNALKNYGPTARREFIAAVTARAAKFGIIEGEPAPVQEQGDLVVIEGEAFPKRVGEQRKKLLARIHFHGFRQSIEEVACTWFNRFLAIRFMELHGYFDHGYRVLSHPDERSQPEILEHAEHLDFPGLDKSKVVDLKLDGTKDAELYRLLLIAQCNALHHAMPFLFERIDDETELLLPDNLLHSDSLICGLVGSIDEADWGEIEIIGWLYQFYISEKKDEVIGKVVKPEDIPAATQLFTPNWIVKYMVQNSLGSQWLATYPDSSLNADMEYYIEPADQTEEVRRQLADITPKDLNPEELTLIDPACGSGHILSEAYDLFKSIYLERGYRLRDISRLILEKNLYGLDIDDRAAQMAGFTLLMKARADDRHILASDNPPIIHVMAIQGSMGLDAKDIARTLLPKGRYELVPDDDLFLDTITQPVLSTEMVSAVRPQTISTLIDLFANAKTYGSLITVPEDVARALPTLEKLIKPTQSDDLYQQQAKSTLLPLIKQATILSKKFGCTVFNPPYMGTRYMDADLKDFIESNFRPAKHDLYSSIIDRAISQLHSNGIASFVAMHGWMFLSSMEEFRTRTLSRGTILSCIHLGSRAFSEDVGTVVQTAALSIRRGVTEGYASCFLDITSGKEIEKHASLRSRTCQSYVSLAADFLKINGTPMAYWMPDPLKVALQNYDSFEEHFEPRQGLASSDDNRFLKRWSEVSFSNIGFGAKSRAESQDSGKRWFPCLKGGDRRKWYGNNDLVVNCFDDGREILNFAKEKYGSPTRTIKNIRYYFRPGVTWGRITGDLPTFRVFDCGFVITDKGPAVFAEDKNSLLAACGFLNSIVSRETLHAFSPNFGVEIGHIKRLPYKEVSQISSLVAQAISTAKDDWDSFEASWDFSGSPLLVKSLKGGTVAESFTRWDCACKSRIEEMRRVETKINKLIIQSYDLSDHMNTSIPDDQITISSADRAENIKSLISYAIGCMMGRYSLTEPGLINANVANDGFDPSRYGDFPADDDGIVPITVTEWFDDDAAVRFEEFIYFAWSPETLRENLRYVADSIASNGGNDPHKTIRNYFSKFFFKDHLKSYKKRPIYWLFSSGKQKAFECLVYLHRYNESTLSRMRMEYVTPLQSRIAARIEQLSGDVETASSSAERNRKQKEKDKLVMQLDELRKFDEELRHFADQRITLDLDDGVKINYGKFGNLVAERKAITGEK
jgi:hypothetical protein